MLINLIVQYYKCGNTARQEEIDTCLRKNLQNEWISAVHLLTEDEYDFALFPNIHKINQAVIGERLTYEKAFQYANSQGCDEIWIVSNADIYFDDSLQYLIKVPLVDTIYALSRHEVNKDGSVEFIDEEYAHGSQDAWIFRAPLKLDGMLTDIRLGAPGCDNRIAYEFISTDLTVVNPSKVIKCYHLDLTREICIERRTEEYIQLQTDENIRNGVIAPPPYQFYIYPTDMLGIEKFGVYKEMQKKLCELTDAHIHINNCSNHINELGGIIAQRDAEIVQRDAEIAAIKDSLSWKITGPLRKLHRIMHR